MSWFVYPQAHAQGEFPIVTQLTTEHAGVIDAIPSGFTGLNGVVYFGISGAKGGLWRTEGAAQGVVLVKDVQMLPSSLQRVGDLLYFVVQDGDQSQALWKSDGTPEGTVPLKSGLNVSSSFVAMGNTIFFVANDLFHGNELWQSDGTPEGTLLVADLNPGPTSADPDMLVASTDYVYFTGYDEQRLQRLLWESDGTAAGTRAVAGAPQAPRELVTLQDVLYFAGSDAEHGHELWRYAPGDLAASLVADIFPGSDSSNIDNMLGVGERLFFSASDDAHGRELWQSDGTAAGTQLVKDIVPGVDGSNPNYLMALNNQLYFVADTTELGTELWKSDGAAAGTMLVDDIIPGPDSSAPSRFTISADGQLYFTIVNAESELEFWKSNGTLAGTQRFSAPGQNPTLYGPFTAIDDVLYFASRDETHGAALWVSDGTAAGTRFVADLDPNHGGLDFGAFARVNKRLYFTVPANTGAGMATTQLWMRDGADAEAVLIDAGLNIAHMESLGNTLLVVGADAGGAGLWKHDGATQPPELLRRLKLDVAGELGQIKGQAYFLASDESSSAPLRVDIWRTDGTVAGTVNLTQDVADFVGAGPSAVFADAYWVGAGSELWVTDGTADGLRHFTPAGLEGDIRQFVVTTDALYFRVQYYTGRLYFGIVDEVWRTNGAPEDTYRLQAPKELLSVNDLTPVGAGLFFTNYKVDRSRELWFNDGASLALNKLVDIPSALDPLLYHVGQYEAVDGRLLFTMDDQVSGPELWSSDGTAAGTALIKDIVPAEFDAVGWASPGPLFTLGDLLFFGANDGVHGKELWRSDGTVDGTFMVTDMNPGIAGSGPDNFIGKGNRFYFTAHDGAHGRELWQSDGTAAGTQLVADLYEGSASSQPIPQLIFDNTIYVTADNGVDGRQLFALFDPGIPLALPIGEEPLDAFPYQYYMPLINR
ncbi:MAG: hypothetical protein H6641_12870 [Caldilineaceae bacterium]|nr:hypothetical protein [Caldilineaceae bacterium]